jgi:integrase
MRTLVRSHVEIWVKGMQTGGHATSRREAATGLAPSTVRTRFNNVRGVLRAAVRDRIIASDPSEGVRLPRVRRAGAAMELPTVAQVHALISAADDYFRAFVALCAFAGLRLGEAAALRVGDFDLGARRLTVRRQVQRAGGPEVEIRPPKYGSERVVYLADGLVGIVRTHIDRLSGTEDDRWLFRGENGNPPHQNTVGYWWRRTRRVAGAPIVKMHDLRHFYASGLIAAGCDVVTVQRALGHGSATVTLKTYAHLWPSAEDRTRAAAAGLLTAVLAVGDERLTNGRAA